MAMEKADGKRASPRFPGDSPSEPTRCRGTAQTDVPVRTGLHLTYGLVETIGRAIVTGQYASACFPTETELMREHGVSRSAIREVVKILYSKGLILARPGHRMTARPLAAWNLWDTDILRWLLEGNAPISLLRQFTELRLAIEPEAAALAAVTADQDGLAAISANIQVIEAADRGLEDPLEANVGFHMSVLRATGNPFYFQMGNLLRAALRASGRFTRDSEQSSLSDFAAVRDAIAARRSDMARGCMLHLIQGAMDRVEATALRHAAGPRSKR